jgi:outer membrane lipoprotein-sorting protein
LRVSAPLGGEPITVVRNGQKIWAYPGSRVKALLADPQIAKTLPDPDKKFKLAPFELPIPEKQLAFLPVLFQVQEAPDEVLDGQPCRVLDLRLQKELAKSLQYKDAKARIWVGPEYRLLRVAARSDQGDTTLRFDQVSFRPALPPETWQPSAEESADVITLSPSVYDQMVKALIGRGK